MIEQYKNNEKTLDIDNKNRIIGRMTKYVIVAALSGAIVAGTVGCTSRAESDPFSRVDAEIESITISPEARIRSGPNVPNRYDPDNIIETVDETMTVMANKDTVIRDDGTNGEWYSVSVDEMKKADPDFKVNGDQSGVVWVNEQRAQPNQ